MVRGFDCRKCKVCTKEVPDTVRLLFRHYYSDGRKQTSFNIGLPGRSFSSNRNRLRFVTWTRWSIASLARVAWQAAKCERATSPLRLYRTRACTACSPPIKNTCRPHIILNDRSYLPIGKCKLKKTFESRQYGG